jgi:hypothetical protein
MSLSRYLWHYVEWVLRLTLLAIFLAGVAVGAWLF